MHNRIDEVRDAVAEISRTRIPDRPTLSDLAGGCAP